MRPPSTRYIYLIFIPHFTPHTDTLTLCPPSTDDARQAGHIGAGAGDEGTWLRHGQGSEADAHRRGQV